ncbi:hypothetical protein DFJ74DRAFT_730776 [Hyaloraphidium curvatum]|nr:hypothetical protein DFJ74DRAFT_730776 [Hyaloraphidium curvatum]
MEGMLDDDLAFLQSLFGGGGAGQPSPAAPAPAPPPASGAPAEVQRPPQTAGRPHVRRRRVLPRPVEAGADDGTATRAGASPPDSPPPAALQPAPPSRASSTAPTEPTPRRESPAPAKIPLTPFDAACLAKTARVPPHALRSRCGLEELTEHGLRMVWSYLAMVKPAAGSAFVYAPLSRMYAHELLEGLCAALAFPRPTPLVDVADSLLLRFGGSPPAFFPTGEAAREEEGANEQAWRQRMARMEEIARAGTESSGNRIQIYGGTDFFTPGKARAPRNVAPELREPRIAPRVPPADLRSPLLPPLSPSQRELLLSPPPPADRESVLPPPPRAQREPLPLPPPPVQQIPINPFATSPDHRSPLLPPPPRVQQLPIPATGFRRPPEPSQAQIAEQLRRVLREADRQRRPAHQMPPVLPMPSPVPHARQPLTGEQITEQIRRVLREVETAPPDSPFGRLASRSGSIPPEEVAGLIRPVRPRVQGVQSPQAPHPAAPQLPLNFFIPPPHPPAARHPSEASAGIPVQQPRLPLRAGGAGPMTAPPQPLPPWPFGLPAPLPRTTRPLSRNPVPLPERFLRRDQAPLSAPAIAPPRLPSPPPAPIAPLHAFIRPAPGTSSPASSAPESMAAVPGDWDDAAIEDVLAAVEAEILELGGADAPTGDAGKVSEGRAKDPVRESDALLGGRPAGTRGAFPPEGERAVGAATEERGTSPGRDTEALVRASVLGEGDFVVVMPLDEEDASDGGGKRAASVAPVTARGSAGTPYGEGKAPPAASGSQEAPVKRDARDTEREIDALLGGPPDPWGTPGPSVEPTVAAEESQSRG